MTILPLRAMIKIEHSADEMRFDSRDNLYQCCLKSACGRLLLFWRKNYVIQIIGSLQLGLLYAAMAMGVFVTFRILDIADLTVDGSFVTGMATAAVVTIAANNPVLGILAGTAAGGLAGLITGLLLTKVKVPPILAGIISLTGLYSINMFIMGEKSNLSLVGQETVFTWVCKASPLNDEIDKLILSALIIAAVAAILAVFF